MNSWAVYRLLVAEQPQEMLLKCADDDIERIKEAVETFARLRERYPEAVRSDDHPEKWSIHAGLYRLVFEVKNDRRLIVWRLLWPVVPEIMQNIDLRFDNRN